MKGLAAPPARPLLGHLSEFQKSPLDFLTRCTREYGDMVPIRFGGMTMLYVSHPDLIEQVLVTDHHSYYKGKGLQRTQVLFGNGLLTSEGEFWRRQRKLVQPAFHRERIARYAEVMTETACKHALQWPENSVMDMQKKLAELTLEIVVRTLFNTDVQEGEMAGRALEVVQNAFDRWITLAVMLPDWCPMPLPGQLRRAIASLDAVVFRLIERRRKEGGDRGDLLSMLLEAQETDGEQMTDRQLRDEVLTLFLAGHETTALALTWTLYLLEKHSAVAEKMHKEVDALPGGRMPQYEDREALCYTRQVLQEAMRLYPPAWSMGRRASAPCMLNGVEIPAGRTVFMSQWVVHRDPRWYSVPEEFRPERWAEGESEGLPRYAYFPFGGGPRVCIGNSFAMQELTLVLATLVKLLTFRTAEGYAPHLQTAVTLRPRNGLPMQICRRG